MDALKRFLDNKSETVLEKGLIILAAYGLNWAYLNIFMSTAIFIDGLSLYSFVQNLFWTCLIAPIVEELVFRKGMVSLTKSSPYWAFWPIMITSSLIFGMMHGGWGNVLIQGVGGFIIAMVYVKNGYCYWSAVILHFLWNFILTIQ